MGSFLRSTLSGQHITLFSWSAHKCTQLDGHITHPTRSKSSASGASFFVCPSRWLTAFFGLAPAFCKSASKSVVALKDLLHFIMCGLKPPSSSLLTTTTNVSPLVSKTFFRTISASAIFNYLSNTIFIPVSFQSSLHISPSSLIYAIGPSTLERVTNHTALCCPPEHSVLAQGPKQAQSLILHLLTSGPPADFESLHAALHAPTSR